MTSLPTRPLQPSNRPSGSLFFPGSRVSKFLAIGLAAAGLATQYATAQTAITWDNQGGDLLWSNALNWNPDSSPASNDVTLGATGTAAANGTTTNTVDQTLAINTLTFSNTGAAAWHTTLINSGVNLAISPASGATAFTVNPSTTSSIGNVAITGAGSMTINGGTTAAFNVGASNAATSGSANTLDMSGLASFSATVSTFNIGTGQRNNGAVTFGTNNAVTATTLQIGGNTSTGGALSSLNLGQTNTINADTIAVGNGRTSGTFQFRTGLTGATLTIANRAGTGGGTLNVGLTDTNASGGPNSTVDFTGGTLNGTFGTIALGRSANGSAGGSGTGNLLFGAGSMTVTNLRVGLGNSGSSTTALGIGNFTMAANAGTVTATTVTLGEQTNGTGANGSNGTFHQNGGSAVITTLNIVNRTSNAAAGGNVTGTYNLNAGTLRAQNIQAGGNGTGTATLTRSFNWAGGTIQNLNSTTDLSIGAGVVWTLSGADAKSFTADPGRSIVVNAALGGTAGFSKAGAGTLALTNAANTYSGATDVNAGTLLVSGSIAGSATTVNDAGAFGAGTAASIIGTATTGAFSLVDTAEFLLDINIASASSATSDLVNVGDLTLDTDNSAVLSLANLGSNLTLDPGVALSFIDYSGTWNGGTFAGLADDSTFTVGANQFRISYNGVNDNDTAVVLVAVPEPASAVFLLGGAACLIGMRRPNRRRA